MGEFDTTIAGSPPSGSAQTQHLEPGDTLDRYRILEELGSGGMGVVYRAHDPVLDREVALKLLRLGGVEQEEGRARLLREARALARLSHPNVLPVFDVGTTETSLYLALELIRGQTLREWIDADRRSVEQILDCYEQAGRGLAAAHAADLVHRDFKPDNVLLGDDGRVRVMDFGLVLEAELNPPLHTPVTDDDLMAHGNTTGEVDGALTEVGTVMGTPGYMAPEQHYAESIDHRCDQYAFCISLFEALHGARPFRGNSVLELSTNKLHKRVERGPTYDRVPEFIDVALRRGLSPKKDDRWPSMDALLEAIRPRRRRWPWIGAGVVALGSIVGLASWLPHSGPSCNAQERLAGVWDADTTERVQASVLATSAVHAQDTWNRVEATLTTQAEQWSAQYTRACAIESVEERDRQLACLKARRQELQTVVELLASTDAQGVGKAVATVEQLAAPERCALAEGPAVPSDPQTAAQVAEVRQRLFKIRAMSRAGQQADAEARLPEAVELARATRFDPVIIQALKTQGSTLLHGQTPANALAPLEQSYWMAMSSSDDVAATETATMLVALTGSILMKTDAAEQWVEHAKTALERAPDDPLLRARLHTALGNARFRQQRIDEAASELAEAVAVFRETPGDHRQDLATNLTNLGSARFMQGDRERAGQCFDESLALLEELFGPRHPTLVTAIMNTANMASSNGDLDGAIAAHRRAIALVEDNLGPDHEKLAGPLNNLGFALLQNGEPDEARPHLIRALAIWERVLGPDHPNLALTLVNLASQDLVEDKFDAAKIRAERALRILEGALGEGTPPTLEPQALLGWALLGLGRRDEGLARLNTVERALDDEAIAVQLRAGSFALLADCLWAEDPPRAIAHARRALTLFESLPSGQTAEVKRMKTWLAEHPQPDAPPTP